MKFNSRIKLWLRNASQYLADQGLDLTLAVIATINGSDELRRGRFRFCAREYRDITSALALTRTFAQTTRFVLPASPFRVFRIT